MAICCVQAHPHPQTANYKGACSVQQGGILRAFLTVLNARLRFLFEKVKYGKTRAFFTHHQRFPPKKSLKINNSVTATSNFKQQARRTRAQAQ